MIVKCDTLNIAPGERWDMLVKATNPGTWAFHCQAPLCRRGRA
jgi:FtsP/CotA-like multicopper oxidase with cupredoxin domain